MKLATRQDITNFEQLPLPKLPQSIYEVIVESASKYPNREAVRFFLQTKDYKK
jgi:hypothetical protein